MTKLEEALGRLGNLELDKNTDDIINYLENNKEKIVIEKQEFSLTDIISFAKNPSLILEKRQKRWLIMVLRHITLIKNL